MSLYTLPVGKYIYLHIDAFETEGKSSVTWDALDSEQDSAQFWIDVELTEKMYVPYIWWKFWKKVDTFKITAYTTSGKNVYETIKLHHK